MGMFEETSDKVPQIEIDRGCLRKNLHRTDSFSYLNYIDLSKENSKNQVKKRKKLKLAKLSTLNILFEIEAHKLFEKSKINNIIELLKSREDFLDAVIAFMRVNEIKDDLYYW